MGKQSRLKQDRQEYRNRVTVTLAQQEAREQQLINYAEAVKRCQCNLESAITWIYASVAAGIKANSYKLISDMLQGQAGILSQFTVNLMEVIKANASDPAIEFLYRLIDLTKNAAGGDCQPLIVNLKQYEPEVYKGLIDNYEIGRNRKRDKATIATGMAVQELMNGRGEHSGMSRKSAVTQVAIDEGTDEWVTDQRYSRWLKEPKQIDS